MKKNKALFFLFLISFFVFVLKIIDHFNLTTNVIIQNAFLYTHTLGLDYFSWFNAGALGYIYYSNRTRVYLSLFLMSSLFAVITYGHLVSLFVVIIFTLPLFNIKVENFLSSKFLLFFGFISYPLYLLHDEISLSIVSKLHNLETNFPILLLPILPILFVIFMSFSIAKYIEPFIKKKINHLVGLLRSG